MVTQKLRIVHRSLDSIEVRLVLIRPYECRLADAGQLGREAAKVRDEAPEQGHQIQVALELLDRRRCLKVNTLRT